MDLRVYAHVFELSMLCDTSVAGWDTTEYHLELKCRDDVDDTLRSHAATMSIAEPTASATRRDGDAPRRAAMGYGVWQALGKPVKRYGQKHGGKRERKYDAARVGRRTRPCP